MTDQQQLKDWWFSFTDAIEDYMKGLPHESTCMESKTFGHPVCRTCDIEGDIMALLYADPPFLDDDPL